MRVPIVRRDLDGTIIDGTAEWTPVNDAGFHISDFRSLDGDCLSLPAGSTFEFLELGDDEVSA